LARIVHRRAAIVENPAMLCYSHRPLAPAPNVPLALRAWTIPPDFGGPMLDPTFTIRPALPDELPHILALYEETARWLWDRGIYQWEPGTFNATDFAPLIARGQLHLATRDADIAGTVTLTWADPDLWGPDDGEAGYVHKLAVRRAYAGQGVSLRLLDFAAQQAAHAGKRHLRHDCWAGNVALRAFYTNAGFTLVQIAQERDEDGAWECALFERVVTAAERA
jgi:GNAT superfamily N-acetyltransferase